MLSALAKMILRLGGWTVIGEIPPLKKAVIIAAPHTSNWDGFWLFVYRVSFGVQLRILAKHTLFWWPLAPALRACGAVPLDRSQSSATVQQLIDMFAHEEHFFLALAPEGTRKKRPYWKTGFFQIASAAKVPIVMAFIDYEKRTMGIGPKLDPAAGIDVILEQLREFYAPFKACCPERQGPIKFPPHTDAEES
jgi:1-acyl-sn-glycerol-3-phosphate acyltransferase